MAGIKELRLRITSVGNIKQITRAMEMVATTKLRRFQDRATSSRPYAEEITGLVGRLAAMLGDGVADKPLFKPGTGNKTLARFVSSDRGLCGAYNAVLLRTMEAWRAKHPRPVDYLVFGRETKGLPDEMLERDPERCLTIPMVEGSTRSINLATSVSAVMFEAIRQLDQSC